MKARLTEPPFSGLSPPAPIGAHPNGPFSRSAPLDTALSENHTLLVDSMRTWGSMTH